MDDQKNHISLSVIIPAKNEAMGLRTTLPRLRHLLPHAEIIVVNDGSSDDTENICRAHGVVVPTHPYSVGNGAAVKSGARIAKGNILVFMDADGQHSPDDIQALTTQLEKGYDMAVGARSRQSQATFGRSIANKFYNLLASWMVGRKIEDLTSGFRALGALEAAGVPSSPVLRMDEVFATPEGAGMVQEVLDPVRGTLRLVADPIRLDGALPPVRRSPPHLGEHTEEILRELGL